MKPIRLVLIPIILLGAPLLRADGPNLLQNGNFSDGSAQWNGDARRPDTGETDPLAAPNSAPQGVVVKLRDGDWSKVSQDFECTTRKVFFKVTYKISPDTVFFSNPSDYENVAAVALNSSLRRATPIGVGQWAIFIFDMAAEEMWSFKVAPAMGTDEVQTIEGKVRTKPGERKGFFLTFPPGKGTITLLSVSVSPANGQDPDQ